MFCLAGAWFVTTRSCQLVAKHSNGSWRSRSLQIWEVKQLQCRWTRPSTRAKRVVPCCVQGMDGLWWTWTVAGEIQVSSQPVHDCMYPLVIWYIAIEAMAIEKWVCPLKTVIFHSDVNVYQRVIASCKHLLISRLAHCNHGFGLPTLTVRALTQDGNLFAHGICDLPTKWGPPYKLDYNSKNYGFWMFLVYGTYNITIQLMGFINQFTTGPTFHFTCDWDTLSQKIKVFAATTHIRP